MRAPGDATQCQSEADAHVTPRDSVAATASGGIRFQPVNSSHTEALQHSGGQVLKQRQLVNAVPLEVQIRWTRGPHKTQFPPCHRASVRVQSLFGHQYGNRVRTSVDTSNPATDRHFKTGHQTGALRLG